MATPRRENILHFCNRSITIRRERIHFEEETGYHVHPEMELAILENGGGIRTVNGIDEEFGELDIVFVPGGIPHCWTFTAGKCTADGKVTDSSCQFPESVLSGTATVFPEFQEILNFYKSLHQAIQITGKTADAIRKRFRDILRLSDFKQTLAVISILTEIYESREYRMVGMPVTDNTPKAREDIRLHTVDRIISENYAHKIPLKDVADTVGMSPTAFCNAFKAMTGTTFNRYLNTYRMQIASSLLRETGLNIGEIAYRVGYSDLPHFTRAFVAYYHQPPTRFREEITQKQQNHDHQRPQDT